MKNQGSVRTMETKIYLVGSGIASLAAAAFLIRDADIPGRNITIFEQLDRLGGSLDGAGSSEDGYVGSRPPDDRKQVCLHVRPVFFHSDFR